MTESNTLAGRIDAEFSALEHKIKKAQSEQLDEYKGRQKRLEQLGKVFDELRPVWKPRLELLAKKFGDRVQVTPTVKPSTREAAFEFQSKRGRVRLKFSASTDRDVRKVVLAYDLEILPIFMRYEPHAEVDFPLEAVDQAAAAKWIDDRIVDFVRTYLSMGENEIYMRDRMVEDPITHAAFPDFAAGATLDWQGQKYYFIAEETRREFAEKNKIAIE
jgi:YHS domain-containing protein